MVTQAATPRSDCPGGAAAAAAVTDRLQVRITTLHRNVLACTYLGVFFPQQLSSIGIPNESCFDIDGF